MWPILKRLSIGLSLIGLTALVLLISDLKSRRSAGVEAGSRRQPGGKIFQVAVLQHASQSILDEGVRGAMDGLKEKGFTESDHFIIRRFNAEGDMATSSAIARSLTDGKYDLVLTMSTLSMQAVANANRAGKVRHVFGLVADPYGAGVGISRQNHLEHPPAMAGYGTLPPVEAAFRLARRLQTGLKTVGVVWNPGESNSEAQLKLARKICQELGIQLLEATVDNSSGVLDAANAVISRGAEALWVGGDVTVLTAVQSVVQAGKNGRVPVFTVIPPLAERGALFDLGANFYEVGKLTGGLAAEILLGRDPAKIPIENVMPETLVINKLALRELKDAWLLPEAVLRGATVVIDETGKHELNPAGKPGVTAARPAGPLSRRWKIHVIELNDVPAMEESRQGVLLGLKAAGLVEGRDYEIKTLNAAGDIPTVGAMVDTAVADQADLLVAISTIVLQSAIKKVHDRPVVFAQVTDPVKAGAGRSLADHLPNVTGSTPLSDHTRMVSVVRQCLPGANRLGTLFNPSEDNSVIQKDELTAAARKAGMEVVTLGINKTTDMADAAVALCSSQVDAVCQISDNLTSAGFVSLVKACRQARVPLFCYQSAQAQAGAVIAVARDFLDAGKVSGELAARILRGESPARIPFQLVSGAQLVVNLPAAQALGMKVPESLSTAADQVIRE